MSTQRQILARTRSLVSAFTDRPIHGSMACNMAKAAIDQMTRTAATELCSQRIRFNTMHPGAPRSGDASNGTTYSARTMITIPSFDNIPSKVGHRFDVSVAKFVRIWTSVKSSQNTPDDFHDTTIKDFEI